MKNDAWSAAFTITVDGQQVDISELSAEMREQIAGCIREGQTQGAFFEQGRLVQPA